MEYLALFYMAAVTGLLVFLIQQARILRLQGKLEGTNAAHTTQVQAFRESNTKLFQQKEEATRIAVDAVRNLREFATKPVIDGSNLDQLAQAIAARLPGNRLN